MQYNQPFGAVDPNASYADRNTPGAVAGSRVPARAIEHPQREIMAVITAAGLTPSSSDLTQLLQAISQMISSATGGSETSTYVLMAAARARLPIFPEIVSADGSFNLSVPATGTVRIPAGIEIIHRGIFSLMTVQQDFSTVANKTYHLRWNPSDGFVFKDLADAAYNPSALPETDAAFDSVYDNMLVARVTTNASNVAAIRNLKNKARLFRREKIAGPSSSLAPSDWNSAFTGSTTLDWARTPQIAGIVGNVRTTGGGVLEYANWISARSVTRYAVEATVNSNWVETMPPAPGGLTGELQFDIAA